MFNVFTALDGALLEESYVVLVVGVVNPRACKCMIN